MNDSLRDRALAAAQASRDAAAEEEALHIRLFQERYADKFRALVDHAAAQVREVLGTQVPGAWVWEPVEMEDLNYGLGEAYMRPSNWRTILTVSTEVEGVRIVCRDLGVLPLCDLRCEVEERRGYHVRDFTDLTLANFGQALERKRGGQ